MLSPIQTYLECLHHSLADLHDGGFSAKDVLEKRGFLFFTTYIRHYP